MGGSGNIPSVEKIMEVAAAVIRRGGQVLIGKRRAGSYYGGYWEFPGGKLEDGETPADCLARELKEELGIDCHVGELLTVTLYEYTDRKVRLYAFHIDDMLGEPRALEHAEIRWVRFEETASLAFVPADIPILRALMSRGN